MPCVLRLALTRTEPLWTTFRFRGWRSRAWKFYQETGLGMGRNLRRGIRWVGIVAIVLVIMKASSARSAAIRIPLALKRGQTRNSSIPRVGSRMVAPQIKTGDTYSRSDRAVRRRCNTGVRQSSTPVSSLPARSAVQSPQCHKDHRCRRQKRPLDGVGNKKYN